MQRVNRVFPVATVHHVVEIGNDVVDRASVVAKRRATVHAARCLLAGLRIVQADDKFLVVFQALGDGLVALFDALVFHEAGDFSHDEVLSIPLLVQVFGPAAGADSALLGGREFLIGGHLGARGFGRGFQPTLPALDQRPLVLVGEDFHKLQA